MNDTLRADRGCHAPVTEVRHFLFRVILAEVAHRPIRRIHRIRIVLRVWLLLLRSLPTCSSMTHIDLLIPSMLLTISCGPSKVSRKMLMLMVVVSLRGILATLARLRLQDLLSNLNEFSCAFWIQNGGALTVLADDGLECVLVLCCLVFKVQGSALEAQVVITGEDEDVFWLPLALGTADVILLVVWTVVLIWLVQVVGVLSMMF